MNEVLIYAILSQVALTLVIGLITLSQRVRAYRQGKVELSYFKHNEGEAPQKMLRCNDNLQNQFELPVLFFVVSLLALITEQVGFWINVLAWLFVISRIVHAYIHIQINHVGYRLASFLFGFVCIITFWILLLFNLMTLNG